MQQIQKWGAAMAALALVAFVAPSFAAQQSGALKVTVEYRGEGTVDADHELFLWVFDTPDITADSVPIAAYTLTSNGASASFTGLPAQVYLAAAFDEKGNYDGSSAPPAGTPITIYGDAMVARAVETGGDASVSVVFDGAVRMP